MRITEYDIYRIYAPRLWKHVQEKRQHGRHPMVMADKDDKKKDDPPAMEMEPFNPIHFYCVFAAIYLVFFLKFVEKSLAKLEFLKRAQKKLIERREAKKDVENCDESTSVQSEVISNNNSMM